MRSAPASSIRTPAAIAHRDEVVEHVLLVLQAAGVVPLPAVLATAAQVGDGQHAPRSIHSAIGTENDGVMAMSKPP